MSDQDRHEYEIDRELYEHVEDEQHRLDCERLIELENGDDNEH